MSKPQQIQEEKKRKIRNEGRSLKVRGCDLAAT